MSTWKELRDNPRLFNIIKTRAEILRLTREFFWSQNFLETDTPIALVLPGQEPYLSPVPVTFHDPQNVPYPLYLHTSPEFALKKLLAAGFSKVFYITKCFRDYEEFGRTHNTEFTMIEWYRAPGNYREILADTEALFKQVGAKLSVETLVYNGHQVPLAPAWKVITMKELWQEYVGVNLDDYVDDTIAPAREKLAVLAGSLGYEVAELDEYEDIFFKIFLNKIEGKLGFDRPTFVIDYPKRLCSLSRTCDHDARYAERFELYVAGLELCNAFGELTDALEQKHRLEIDRELRTQLGKQTWAVDPDFIAALASGIPTAGGIALGIDRMVLLFTGAHDLNEVIFGSVADQIS